MINIERFCERTLWLQFGQAQDFGATRDVMVQFEYFSSWYQALALPEKNEYLAQKEHERQTFDVGTVYEEFKVEQFKHGFTRKDEPRMRKAFYKDRGGLIRLIWQLLKRQKRLRQLRIKPKKSSAEN
nr:hypothetical protein [Liquorilactobacillus satsumensis]